MQTEAPAGEKFPESQFVQTEDSPPVPPSMMRFPALQSEHEGEPASLYWLVLQSEQASPSPLYLPTPHLVQSSTLSWSVASSPVVDLPAGQLRGEVGGWGSEATIVMGSV